MSDMPNIVLVCYVAGKKALFKALVVKNKGFYLH